jgi:hypothetical protein
MVGMRGSLPRHVASHHVTTQVRHEKAEMSHSGCIVWCRYPDHAVATLFRTLAGGPYRELEGERSPGSISAPKCLPLRMAYRCSKATVDHMPSRRDHLAPRRFTPAQAIHGEAQIQRHDKTRYAHHRGYQINAPLPSLPPHS